MKKKRKNKIINFQIVDSKKNEGMKILIASTKYNQYIVAGNECNHTYVKEFCYKSNY